MKKIIETKIDGLKLRFAEEDDVPLILEFIKELAEYENLLDQVVATEAGIRDSIFNRKAAEVVIAQLHGEDIGFALFFHNYSTFLGKPGLYLEDLYIRPQMRGRGIGKILLSFLAKLAIERDCGRFEWWCLDWNESSINFYKSIGAVPMDEWTVYRVDNEALLGLANGFN